MWCTCSGDKECDFHQKPVKDENGVLFAKVCIRDRALVEAMILIENDLRWWDAKAQRHCVNHGRVVLTQAVGGGVLAVLGAVQALVGFYGIAAELARWASFLSVLVGIAITAATTLNQNHQYNLRWKQCRQLCDALEYHLFSAWSGLNEYALDKLFDRWVAQAEIDRAAAGVLVSTHKELVEKARA